VGVVVQQVAREVDNGLGCIKLPRRWLLGLTPDGPGRDFQSVAFGLHRSDSGTVLPHVLESRGTMRHPGPDVFSERNLVSVPESVALGCGVCGLALRATPERH